MSHPGNALQVAGSTDPAFGLNAKDEALYPLLATALTKGPVQFEAVATARFYSKTAYAKDHEQAAAMERFYPRLLHAFADQYGNAGVRIYYCDHGMTAAPLVAEIMGDALGWSAERRAQSLASYQETVARSTNWKRS